MPPRPAPSPPAASGRGPPARGRLIVFEGIDGAGKSSAVAAVAAALAADGAAVWATREETAGPAGELVKRSIREGWPPEATALLFAADRAQHVAEMERHLAAGTHVLCDRFVHSSYAYQASALAGRMPDPLSWLHGLHTGWCPMPDLVLLFTLDPAEALARVGARGGPAAPYEKAAFLAKVQDAYVALARADPGRFVGVDASGPQDEVAAAALWAVRQALA